LDPIVGVRVDDPAPEEEAALDNALDIARTDDRALIRPLLERERIRSGYLLGDLDDSFADVTTWYIATHRGDPVSVVLVYAGDKTRVVLSAGAPDGVASVLRDAAEELPTACGAKIPIEHLEEYRLSYRLDGEQRMWVMGCDLGRDRLGGDWGDVRLLEPDDAVDLMALYDAHYPGHFVLPARLLSGVYVGAYQKGRLVGAAGTHVVSPTMGVAVVGDVVTAESWRGRGLARRCVERLLSELSARGVRTVALHVEDDNAAAISVYRSTGFSFAGLLVQCRGRRTP
jgi:ribosomal protein S18 acetylase RimI-like enzyme